MQYSSIEESNSLKTFFGPTFWVAMYKNMIGRPALQRICSKQTFIHQQRFSSSHSHESTTPKVIEISMAKILGVASILIVMILHQRNQSLDRPIFETRLYKEELSEESKASRDEYHLYRYKQAFIKSYIKDKGGIGQKQIGANRGSMPVPTVLINTHSPYETQFGSGIKTDKLGPRRDRIRLYAPLP